MLTPLDYAIIVVYIVTVAGLGMWAGGKQTNVEDYFLGSRRLPWTAVSLSIVATETSTLTVLGVPAVAYGGSFTFLQLALGYIVGRAIVAAFFIPAYFKGELTTAYGLLAERFGQSMRVSASVTFMITRLLADGVRLFATAIPVKVIASAAGVDISYFIIIAGLAVLTILYTLIGGLRAVVWMDVLQLIIYMAGAGVAIALLLQKIPGDWVETAISGGKFHLFDFSSMSSLTYILTSENAFVTAVVGGAIFSMASHGTDHLIVQRLLACRDIRDSRRALVSSAFFVLVQFAIFLFVGLLLWVFYSNAPPEALGLSRTDEVFPHFIVSELPPGVSGLVLAAIVAAAMSTLSSSLNALASSTWNDIVARSVTSISPLFASRVITLVWGLVFIFFASLFESRTEPVVILGLSIAAFTYGGLLGAFLLGIFNGRASQSDAVLSFFFTIVTMAIIITGLRFTAETGWILNFNTSQLASAYEEVRKLAWPWYTTFGAVLGYTTGSLLSLRHRDAPEN